MKGEWVRVLGAGEGEGEGGVRSVSEVSGCTTAPSTPCRCLMRCVGGGEEGVWGGSVHRPATMTETQR